MQPHDAVTLRDVLSALAALAVPIVTTAIVFIAKSLGELNTRVAVILERVDSHEKRISRLEDTA